MPTVLRIKGFRFFFFSREGSEPPHIHVEHGDKVAKYWLTPVNLASSYGFKGYEHATIRAIVTNQKIMFLEKWNEHFSS